MKIPVKIRKALEAANVPATLPTGRKFLVIGPHVWGKGETFEEAYSNARREGAGVEKQMIVQDVPEQAHVDEMGYTVWTWEEHESKPAEAQELLRFGVK